MYVLRLQRIGLLVIAIVSLICPRSVSAADEPTLTNEQIKQFLLTAKVIKSKQSGKGVTSPWRLTLSDGTVTHDASFQAVDEDKRHKRKVQAPDADAWNKQMYRVRVFDQLVADTDANLTNVLIGPDWKIYRVDFSRAFRLSKDL